MVDADPNKQEEEIIKDILTAIDSKLKKAYFKKPNEI